ncbi:MAG: amino acid carrier protein [Candidatus Thioglobus sp.]|jgi:AGCS family alanine or glycine:cation symporter|nr:sodium:alanine symporter family protein [Gammaproteobacteria bacterium]MDP6163879.1 amino acid carrier protein [Candidatus Thioglobus sp.]HJL79637.1 amino acid carrier protein [Gammaproteobacteria bacterium]HJN00550.1 amino acid carrier protein [Gammaproteobacteria bacterium]|tara:strand:- start:16177 stop:17832 length:1656 start_codon:yes stop_codon:yes gene_type:complete
MEEFKLIIEAIGGFLWNNYTLYAVVVTGIVFTIWSGFSQYYALTHGFKVIKGDYDNDDDPGAISHFQALSTALSATVGLGNIGGVALAISLGGPGAVFWMWVVGFLGMAIKLSEVSLSMIHRNIDEADNPSGGPMWVVERNFSNKAGLLKPLGKLIAGTFCFALIVNTITAGNMFQAWNVANLTQAYFGVPTLATGTILAVVVGAVIIGGIKRIGAVTSKLVPIMLLIYVMACIYVLAINLTAIPEMLALIVSAAFSPMESSNAFLGGTAGSAFIFGMQRALFSNEAGQGSSAIAHSAAKTDEPIREGVVAGLEPFIDTLVVCTMSALVILVTGIWNRPAEVQLSDLTISQMEQSWSIDGVIEDAPSLKNGNKVFMIYSGTDNKEAGNDLHKVYGTVVVDGPTKSVAWNAIVSEKRPETNGEVYLDYVGANLTAAAFDKVSSGLGKWLVTLASWLFAISTMISWSYYGEKGVSFLLGEKAILAYKLSFCILAIFSTTGFIQTDKELNLFANLGTGLCIMANLPILWLFGYQAMRDYKQYISKLKAGEFTKV